MPRSTRPSHRTPNAEIDDLKQQVLLLRQTVAQLAEVTAVENVLTHGFETLSAQLQPLRDLAYPARERLAPERTQRLLALRLASARPDWSGAGELDVLYVDGVAVDPAQQEFPPTGRTYHRRHAS